VVVVTLLGSHVYIANGFSVVLRRKESDLKNTEVIADVGLTNLLRAVLDFVCSGLMVMHLRTKLKMHPE